MKKSLPTESEPVRNVGGRPRAKGFTREQHRLLAPELDATIRGLSRLGEGIWRCFSSRTPTCQAMNKALRDVDKLYLCLDRHAKEAGCPPPLLLGDAHQAYSEPFFRWAGGFDQRAHNRRALPRRGVTREMHVELARELYGIEAGLLYMVRGMNRAGFLTSDVALAERAARSVSELITTLDADFQDQEGFDLQHSPYRFHREVAQDAKSRTFAVAMAALLNPGQPMPDWLMVDEAYKQKPGTDG